ncbi:MAG: dipeptidyl-peptidase-4 [Flavobacteriaceae bacterium]|jgi:dipeptidyl-peptidase-4
MKKHLSIILIFLATLLTAQETKHLTLEDAVLGRYKGLYPAQKSFQWVSNSDRYAFSEDNSLFISKAFQITKEIIRPVLQLEELQKETKGLKRLPNFSSITNEEVTFNHQNEIVIYNYTNNYITRTISYPAEAENNDYNEKASAVAYTLDNNLYLANTKNQKIAITKSKDKNIVSGQAIARSEFGITHGIFWSPNGSHIAFYQKDERNVTDYPLVDVNTTPASLNNIKYPMNGMRSEIPKVGVYSLAKNKVVYLKINTSDEHYLTNLSWSPDEKYVFLAEINRDQNHMSFNMYDIASGQKVKTLFEEKNDKWVEPEHTAVFIPNSTTEFLWLSERDGFRNIYVYDINNGFIKQLTNYSWVIKGIAGFDSKNKNVIISGTGDDPRENRAFKVNLKNGKTQGLTTEAGRHGIKLSPNGNYIIDSYSNINTPRIVKVKAIQKKEERVVFTADNPIKDFQLGTTEFVNLKTKNGVNLYGRIIKPANFDASKKYPVLIYVYGGPHAQMVTNSWMAGSNLWMQWMAAEQDYVIFTLDNRGSASRGFAFESVIHRQVGEAEMEDQLTGVNYLKSLPFVDGKRLAVHGWSYGGFMTNSLMLRHPGVFTTAVAGGPVTDWKWYEVMYGERYMDRWQENEAGFDKSRVHNYVENLDGKLLEIIGSVDPVVVPQHTMTLLDAFVKNKKQVDFLSYPMHPHNVRGIDRAHLMKKVLDYVILNNN